MRVAVVVGDGAGVAILHKGARHREAADVDVQVWAAVHEGVVAAALAAVARTAVAAAVVAQAVPGCDALRNHKDIQVVRSFVRKEINFFASSRRSISIITENRGLEGTVAISDGAMKQLRLQADVDPRQLHAWIGLRRDHTSCA